MHPFLLSSRMLIISATLLSYTANEPIFRQDRSANRGEALQRNECASSFTLMNLRGGTDKKKTCENPGRDFAESNIQNE